MRRRSFVQLGVATGVAAALPVWSAAASVKTPPAAKEPPTPNKPKRDPKNRITTKERRAAAAAARSQAVQAGVTAVQAAGPGVQPRYFLHPNYANSPLTVSGATISINVEAGGSGYTDPVVEITDASPTAGGAAAVATFDATTGAILAVRVTRWGSGYTAPTLTIADPTGSGAVLSTQPYSSVGIRKFVDRLPGLGIGNANNLGQYIPIAVPDTTTYPGSDYYEIAVVEYTEKMHSDLPPTKLRGYVQLNGGDPTPHYLGPAIIASKDRPVRVLLRNQLPAGQGGNLFVPVDTTVMGSGMGPGMGGMDEPDPQRPMAGELPKPMGAFTENRATLHLHGGTTPWISDGTPHQWIVPANETNVDTFTAKGVSAANVPDMPDPGPGAQTFYYTNHQSARLLFYHDHSWGITRLNVYVGEAAPYVITDPTEAALVTSGIIPPAADTIPLVIQDKTFVPPAQQLAAQDETWDTPRWGGLGSLWMPHVYSPAQNPNDPSGVNPYGRWAYGPWFWPPTSSVKYPPIQDQYGDPGDLVPSAPYVSMGMEAFADTPVVNGTAYPTLTVEPKAYRFRILNAANDRFFNLSLYEADPSAPTEVALNAAEVAAALDDPAGVFPTPDTAISPAGPSWIQIGTEGGFLPTPVVIPPHVTTWVTDPTVFNAGNVDQHSLLLGPAERAEVIVDFSQQGGKTFMLYNDAPAAFPARDPRYDYYTGNPDLTDTGGAPSTIPGYGPNTRTVMQIRVAAGTGTPFNLPALQTAFKSTKLGGLGVFESSQHPIVVGQQEYNLAYGTAFTAKDGLVQIFNTSLTFKNILDASLTMPLQPKMIQDEMGEAFEHDYGRMSGFLGVETPNAQAGLQNMILVPYTYPPTEVIDAPIEKATTGTAILPIASADDGSQIWKITHNGVDTHPIHFHLYDVQLLNRVGWDGIIRRPDANELGWKDTVRISPLEDTIVALRPIIPYVPFDLPNSVRLLDPSMPEGAYIANTTAAEAAGLPIFAFNPDGEPVDIINHKVNFGWEYVWHCHILSHEEMDMMHSQVVGVAPIALTELTATRVGNGANRRVDLAWNDRSRNETSWVVERATSATGPWSVLATITSATASTVTDAAHPKITYTNPIGNTNTVFYYRVKAINVVGDTWDYSNPAFNEIPPGGGFPTATLTSGYSNVATWSTGGGGGTLPAAPSNVAVVRVLQGANVRMRVAWNDNSNNETGFRIERATNSAFSQGLVASTVGANVTTFTTGNLARNTSYYFRVRSENAAGWSVWVLATPSPLNSF